MKLVVEERLGLCCVDGAGISEIGHMRKATDCLVLDRLYPEVAPASSLFDPLCLLLYPSIYPNNPNPPSPF